MLGRAGPVISFSRPRSPACTACGPSGSSSVVKRTLSIATRFGVSRRRMPATASLSRQTAGPGPRRAAGRSASPRRTPCCS
eukprot:2165713-Lingulodinium_polyedra.AAC.1